MSYTAGKVKTFSCPNCGGSVIICAVGISITATCRYCGSVIDVANEKNLKVIQTSAKEHRKTELAIGLRATLFGMEWQVIGYMKRHAGGGYNWEEYLLFNPWHGFRFLVCSDGHWNFVKTIHQDIKHFGNTKIECAGQEYKLFSKGTAKVSHVMGEFYWRVNVGEKAKFFDFIAPPYIISKEESNGEITWSQGVYVEKEVIAKAFNLPSLMKPEGVAPNQLSLVAKNLPKIKRLFFCFSAILCLLQILAVTYFSESNRVFSQTIHTTPENKGQVVLSEPLMLTGRTANLEIILSSSINNDWLELATSLTNDNTEETFDVSQVVEYYNGYDDEGFWSEGSQSDESIISAIPAGKYHLSLIPNAGAYNRGKELNFHLTIKRAVSISSNFFVALAALALYPLIMLYRHYSFEKRRWANSDYAVSDAGDSK